MTEDTQARFKKSTLKRLSKHATEFGDSYDSIVNRLIDIVESKNTKRGVKVNES